jgi:hypothetical protein
MEVEYIACCEAAKDASWTRQFINELPLTIWMQSLPILYTDNETTNKLFKKSCLPSLYSPHRSQISLCLSGSQMWEFENHGHQREEPASGPAHEYFTNEFSQGMERKNWPNTTSMGPILVGRHKVDLAVTTTAEEQKWVNEFVIAADEETII